MAPRILKRFIWASLIPHLGPRGTLNNPKQLPKRPDGEAEGPRKPPKPIWKRISAYFPTLEPSKTSISPRRGLYFRKTKVGDLKMLFRVFGGSLWLLFGAPGGVLGALLVLLGAPGGTPTSPNFSFGHP